MKKPIPPTINIHSLIPCNYRCGFCYAGFPEVRSSRMPQDHLLAILKLIVDAPLPKGCKQRKVTFAGGEPLLSKTVEQDIAFARSLRLVTSLVTNGSLLTSERLNRLGNCLDWLTISIDSVVPETNLLIGRARRRRTLTQEEYLAKIWQAKDLGIRTKINTVLNRFNYFEDFVEFIAAARPIRWKILQVTKVEGENGDCFDKWALRDDEFSGFVKRHLVLEEAGITVVPEAEESVRSSYAMISPDGRFFDSTSGRYRYSRPILDVGIEEAFREEATISFPDLWGGLSFPRPCP